MKTPKIKRYRLGVSRAFPTTHPKKGEPTYFVEKIIVGQIDVENFTHIVCSQEYDSEIVETCNDPKLHTCRANYPLWEKRIKEVQAGRAVIELFYWEDKPYRSKQVVFAVLDKDSGCGVQKMTFNKEDQNKPVLLYPVIEDRPVIEDIQTIRKNDGLEWKDFKSWFKNYDLSEPMAIIQFTKFRY